MKASGFSLVVTAFLAGFFPWGAAAQGSGATEAGPPFTLTFTPSLVSNYLFRGQRLGGPSLQPSLELVRGNFGMGIWSSFPLSHKVDGVSDPEVDPYAYYVVPVFGTVSVIPGFTVYTYPRAETSRGFYRSTFEPNLALSADVHGVKFTPKIYYDCVLKGTTLELTASYAIPLKELGTELDLAAQAGDYQQRDATNHSASATKAWGQYWSTGVSVPFQFPDGGRVVLGFSYAKGTSSYLKEGSAAKFFAPLTAGRGIVTLSYAHPF